MSSGAFERTSSSQGFDEIRDDAYRARRSKLKLALFRLGVFEILLGSISCLLCLASICVAATTPPAKTYWHSFVFNAYYNFEMTYVSAGIWCGAFLIISGALGMRVRAVPSACMFHASLTLAVICAIMMALMVFISVYAAIATNSEVLVVRSFHFALAGLGSIGLVTCLVHAGYCCVGTWFKNINFNKRAKHTIPQVSAPLPVLDTNQGLTIPALEDNSRRWSYRSEWTDPPATFVDSKGGNGFQTAAANKTTGTNVEHRHGAPPSYTQSAIGRPFPVVL